MAHVNAKVIAEGNVITPEMFKDVTDLGVHCTLGGAIQDRKKSQTFINALINNTIKKTFILRMICIVIISMIRSYLNLYCFSYKYLRSSQVFVCSL